MVGDKEDKSFMKPLIVANWKCNPTTSKEAKRILNLVRKEIKDIGNVEVAICPPFVYLSNFKFQISNFRLGAQNCFWEEEGAYTGAVSPLMLKNLGCKYVIIGHSERRRFFNETDEAINKKIRACLKASLRPILCVGDKSRISKKDIEEVQSQLSKALRGIKPSELKNLVIAYEPIWAISGTNGIVANPSDVREANLFIKKFLIKKFGQKESQEVRILYGGSVNSKNVCDFIYEGQMDGALVGGASLKPKEFIQIVKNVSEA